MRLPDPGALRVGHDDGDGVARGFEVLDEGEDVGGGLGGGGPVVVGDLVGLVDARGFGAEGMVGPTRMCMVNFDLSFCSLNGCKMRSVDVSVKG